MQGTHPRHSERSEESLALVEARCSSPGLPTTMCSWCWC